MTGRHRRGRHQERSTWPLTVLVATAAVVVLGVAAWPDPLPPPPPAAAIVPSTPTAIPEPVQYVTVGRDESLAGIASEHGTTWPVLAALNDLNRPDQIRPGQRLQLPTR